MKMAKEEAVTVQITENNVKAIMDMGFDAISCVQALVESLNDVDKGTMLLVSNPKKYAPSDKQLESLKSLKEIG